ncbi:hypothetical protein MCHI_001549 [Candidatus Magnetoovum chiemensis]|nr:hypothetical protein MCHI_001549 [Candidatus Magnetoovum chiemensis]
MKIENMLDIIVSVALPVNTCRMVFMDIALSARSPTVNCLKKLTGRLRSLSHSADCTLPSTRP